MIVSFENNSIKEMDLEEAFVTKLTEVGNNVTIQLDDNNHLENGDFVMIGALGNPKTEIARINSIPATRQSIQVNHLDYAHNPDDPIFKLLYNQARLYYAITLEATKDLRETQEIDVDQELTNFVVNDEVEGYFFFTLYNPHTNEESGFSAPISVKRLAQGSKTKQAVREIIKNAFPADELDEGKITSWMSVVLQEIYAIRAWRFREGEATFTIQPDKKVYDITEDLALPDFDLLLSARTDNRQLRVITSQDDDILTLNNTLASDTIFEWAGKFHLYTGRTEDITIKYYRKPDILATPEMETEIPLISTLAFGVLKYLYAASDMTLSNFYAQEYNKNLQVMIKNDRKLVGNFTALKKFSGGPKDIITPNITI